MSRKFWNSISLSLVSVLFVSGCGLRLDIGSSAEMDPDPAISIRESAVLSVSRVQTEARELHLRLTAGDLSLDTDVSAESLEEFLARVERKTTEQLDLLGPLSGSESDSNDSDDNADNGDDNGTVAAEDTDQELASSPVSLRKFTESLAQLSDQLFIEVVEAEPELARLLGSIAASSIVWRLDLAEITSPDAELDLNEERIPDVSHPNETWISLIASWDHVAYLLEIAAARGGDSRESFADQAAEYRERAREWARAFGIEGGDGDPRLISYATPELSGDFERDVELLTDEVRAVISAADATLGDLLYEVDPEQRPSVIWQLVNIETDNRRWGIESGELPGLPETGEGLTVD